MRKILVVDDEPLARQNIIFKIKKSGFNFEWIKEASDAEQALDIISETRPDILITDIEMKEINGIVLLETIATISKEKKLTNMVFIIISGYSNFSYAQNAIRLNVADYLLKPVNQQDLTTSLNNALISLEASSSEQNFLLKQELMEDQKARDKLVKNMNLMLNCDIKSEKETMHGYFDIVPQYYSVVVCRILNSSKNFFKSSTTTSTHISPSLSVPSSLVQNGDYQNYSLAKYAISNIANELSMGRMFCFENQNEYRQLVFVIVSDAVDARLATINIKNDINNIYTSIQTTVGIEVDMGISSASTILSSELMQQAKGLLDLRLSNSNHIFYYDEVTEPTATPFQDSEVKMFEQVISANDLYTANRLVEKIICSSAVDGIIRVIYIELICILSKICYKKKIDTSFLLGTEVVNGSIIDTFVSKNDMVEDIQKRIDKLFTPANVGYENVNELMQSIRRYIDENFTDRNLSTNIIARKFCISLGYLSSSFTKAFSITITGYIVNKKIEYSCQLLMQTNISITNISEMIGFNNLSYYMRAFKKQKKVTPTEFRENNKLNI